MNIIYAEYNMYRNSIDIYTHTAYMLRIDCDKAEDGIKTTPCSQCALNALAIDEPLEYARLYLVSIPIEISILFGNSEHPFPERKNMPFRSRVQPFI